MSENEIKLVKLLPPQPSQHPDPRMNWTLQDVRRMFPTRKYTTPIPFVFPKKGGV